MPGTKPGDPTTFAGIKLVGLIDVVENWSLNAWFSLASSCSSNNFFCRLEFSCKSLSLSLFLFFETLKTLATFRQH